MTNAHRMHYLNVTDSLRAAFGGDAEGLSMLDRLAGSTVYALAWNEDSVGFASARNANSAKRILRAHERGYGRDVRNVTARRWGSPAQLEAWALSRCATGEPVQASGEVRP